MIKVSLAVNIVVLTTVCLGIINKARWIPYGYGGDQPSLRILLAVYLAILISSFILLLRPNLYFICALLGLQVTYKFLTPFTVGSLYNPVVLSNLLVALLHSITLYRINIENFEERS